MKITFVALTLCKGGAQRVLVDIANGLFNRGHDVVMVMPPWGDVEYDVKPPISRSRGPVLMESDLPKSDIIVSNFFTTVPVVAEACSKGKGKHLRFSLCYEPMFLPEQDVSFQSYNQTPYLVVISNYQKQLISLVHGIEGEIMPVYVEDTFRNLSIRNPNRLSITAIVRKPEGGFSWQRDQTYLLEQLVKVRSAFPALKYNLICPPNELASSPFLQELRASGSYHFYTPANDEELCHHYNEADIFVTSSIFETAVLPGLEAMKCGAALAAVYAGGNTEYCRHETNCLLSYRFEERLASDIIRLITNPSLRFNLAQAGQKEALSWSLERSVAIFEEICLRIHAKS
ncbi:glycosyltransferase family 4 protein [Ectobacillus sp. JY-23]|uniref:glycosyltransferase family 4 protein n=1 Tax=Ectobacillus sp. JY-23 TaxID=2933872 RepID=UPI001FF6C519|nr:glycosyltransferase family 4 protein [Ectobacillus sp. JY-23]UOY92164.1 glycosyltransferase family 4 protein [Ectobacillus sp. JY-23]